MSHYRTKSIVSFLLFVSLLIKFQNKVDQNVCFSTNLCCKSNLAFFPFLHLVSKLLPFQEFFCFLHFCSRTDFDVEQVLFHFGKKKKKLNSSIFSSPFGPCFCPTHFICPLKQQTLLFVALTKHYKYFLLLTFLLKCTAMFLMPSNSVFLSRQIKHVLRLRNVAKITYF